MAHTYASVAELNDYFRDNGGSALSTESAANIARKLAILESSSRRVDTFCDRSRKFGSGFGPRIGTNRYSWPNSRCLDLYDDLISVTSVSAIDYPTGASRTITDETDFYKHTGQNYDASPYRSLTIHEASSAYWGVGTRGNSIAGKWGYQDSRLTLTTLSSAVASTSTTSISLTATAYPGQTLYIDTEQLYVTSVSGSGPYTATVVRGANGTTAATHLISTTVERFVYPSEVIDTTLRLALRRWRSRDAGADGTEGGFDMPVTTQRESEDTILRRGVGHLRIFGAA